jgi:hypothetical protein
VTENVHLLSHCVAVMVMNADVLNHYGAYKDLMGRGVDFASAWIFPRRNVPINSKEKQDANNAARLEGQPA